MQKNVLVVGGSPILRAAFVLGIQQMQFIATQGCAVDDFQTLSSEFSPDAVVLLINWDIDSLGVIRQLFPELPLLVLHSCPQEQLQYTDLHGKVVTESQDLNIWTFRMPADLGFVKHTLDEILSGKLK